MSGNYNDTRYIVSQQILAAHIFIINSTAVHLVILVGLIDLLIHESPRVSFLFS